MSLFWYWKGFDDAGKAEDAVIDEKGVVMAWMFAQGKAAAKAEAELKETQYSQKKSANMARNDNTKRAYIGQMPCGEKLYDGGPGGICVA